MTEPMADEELARFRADLERGSAPASLEHQRRLLATIDAEKRRAEVAEARVAYWKAAWRNDGLQHEAIEEYVPQSTLDEADEARYATHRRLLEMGVEP